MKQLSDDVLKAMGFRKINDHEDHLGEFFLIATYEIRGISCSEPSMRQQRIIDGVNVSATIGSSLNKMTRTILGINFTEDEAEWRKKKGASPPYLMICFGPTKVNRSESGYIREHDDETLMFYASFPNAIAEAKDWKEIAAVFETSFMLAFSQEHHRVTLEKRSENLVGLNESGKVLQIIQLSVTGQAILNRRLEADDLNKSLEQSLASADGLPKKAANLFSKALTEKTEKGRFMNHYNSIEMISKYEFSEFSQSQIDSIASVVQPRLNEAIKSIQRSQRKDWANTREQFIACSVLLWSDISDTDVKDFIKIKAARDKMSHGSQTSNKPEVFSVAERLARKILSHYMSV